MNIIKKLFGIKEKKNVISEGCSRESIKNNQQDTVNLSSSQLISSSAIHNYIRTGLFNKFVSILVTACFIISIVNLPAFADIEEIKEKVKANDENRGKQENVMNTNPDTMSSVNFHQQNQTIEKDKYVEGSYNLVKGDIGLAAVTVNNDDIVVNSVKDKGGNEFNSEERRKTLNEERRNSIINNVGAAAEKYGDNISEISKELGYPSEIVNVALKQYRKNNENNSISKFEENESFTETFVSAAKVSTEAVGNVLENTALKMPGVGLGVEVATSIFRDSEQNNNNEETILKVSSQEEKNALNNISNANNPIEKEEFTNMVNSVTENEEENKLVKNKDTTVSVNDKDSINISKNEDGTITIKDPNLNEGKPVTYNEEEFEILYDNILQNSMQFKNITVIDDKNNTLMLKDQTNNEEVIIPAEQSVVINQTKQQKTEEENILQKAYETAKNTLERNPNIEGAHLLRKFITNFDKGNYGKGINRGGEFDYKQNPKYLKLSAEQRSKVDMFASQAKVILSKYMKMAETGEIFKFFPKFRGKNFKLMISNLNSETGKENTTNEQTTETKHKEQQPLQIQSQTEMQTKPETETQTQTQAQTQTENGINNQIKQELGEEGYNTLKQITDKVNSERKDGESEITVEQVYNEFKEAGVTKEQINEALRVFNKQNENNVNSIINCATNAIKNVMKSVAGGDIGGLDMGILAIQALAIDIATGSYAKKNTNEDGSIKEQMETSADAIVKVLNSYGIDVKGYSADVEGLKSLETGESAIVHVNGNHYITVTKNEDGIFKVEDPNVNDGKEINFTEEEFNKLMNNESATGRDLETDKQIKCEGYKATDENKKITLITNSETVAEQGTELSIEQLQQIFGASAKSGGGGGSSGKSSGGGGGGGRSYSGKSRGGGGGSSYSAKSSSSGSSYSSKSSNSITTQLPQNNNILGINPNDTFSNPFGNFMNLLYPSLINKLNGTFYGGIQVINDQIIGNNKNINSLDANSINGEVIERYITKASDEGIRDFINSEPVREFLTSDAGKNFCIENKDLVTNIIDVCFDGDFNQFADIYLNDQNQWSRNDFNFLIDLAEKITGIDISQIMTHDIEKVNDPAICFLLRNYWAWNCYQEFDFLNDNENCTGVNSNGTLALTEQGEILSAQEFQNDSCRGFIDDENPLIEDTGTSGFYFYFRNFNNFTRFASSTRKTRRVNSRNAWGCFALAVGGTQNFSTMILEQSRNGNIYTEDYKGGRRQATQFDVLNSLCNLTNPSPNGDIKFNDYAGIDIYYQEDFARSNCLYTNMRNYILDNNLQEGQYNLYCNGIEFCNEFKGESNAVIFDIQGESGNYNCPNYHFIQTKPGGVETYSNSVGRGRVLGVPGTYDGHQVAWQHIQRTVSTHVKGGVRYDSDVDNIVLLNDNDTIFQDLSNVGSGGNGNNEHGPTSMTSARINVLPSGAYARGANSIITIDRDTSKPLIVARGTHANVGSTITQSSNGHELTLFVSGGATYNGSAWCGCFSYLSTAEQIQSYFTSVAEEITGRSCVFGDINSSLSLSDIHCATTFTGFGFDLGTFCCLLTEQNNPDLGNDVNYYGFRMDTDEENGFDCGAVHIYKDILITGRRDSGNNIVLSYIALEDNTSGTTENYHAEYENGKGRIDNLTGIFQRGEEINVETILLQVGAANSDIVLVNNVPVHVGEAIFEAGELRLRIGRENETMSHPYAKVEEISRNMSGRLVLAEDINITFTKDSWTISGDSNMYWRAGLTEIHFDNSDGTAAYFTGIIGVNEQTINKPEENGNEHGANNNEEEHAYFHGYYDGNIAIGIFFDVDSRMLSESYLWTAVYAEGSILNKGSLLPDGVSVADGPTRLQKNASGQLEWDRIDAHWWDANGNWSWAGFNTWTGIVGGQIYGTFEYINYAVLKIFNPLLRLANKYINFALKIYNPLGLSLEIGFSDGEFRAWENNINGHLYATAGFKGSNVEYNEDGTVKSMDFNRQEQHVANITMEKISIAAAVVIATVIFVIATGGMGIAAVPGILGAEGGIVAGISAAAEVSASTLASAAFTSYFTASAALNAMAAYEREDWTGVMLNILSGLLAFLCPFKIGGGGARAVSNEAVETGANAMAESSAGLLSRTSARVTEYFTSKFSAFSSWQAFRQAVASGVKQGCEGTVNAVRNIFGRNGVEGIVNMEGTGAWQQLSQNIWFMTKLQIGMNAVGQLLVPGKDLFNSGMSLIDKMFGINFFSEHFEINDETWTGQIYNFVFGDMEERARYSNNIFTIDPGQSLLFGVVMYFGMPFFQGLASSFGTTAGIGAGVAEETSVNSLSSFIKEEAKIFVEGMYEEQVKENIIQYGLIGVGVSPEAAEFLSEFFSPDGVGQFQSETFASNVISTTKMSNTNLINTQMNAALAGTGYSVSYDYNEGQSGGTGRYTFRDNSGSEVTVNTENDLQTQNAQMASVIIAKNGGDFFNTYNALNSFAKQTISDINEGDGYTAEQAATMMFVLEGMDIKDLGALSPEEIEPIQNKVVNNRQENEAILAQGDRFAVGYSVDSIQEAQAAAQIAQLSLEKFINEFTEQAGLLYQIATANNNFNTKFLSWNGQKTILLGRSMNQRIRVAILKEMSKYSEYIDSKTGKIDNAKLINAINTNKEGALEAFETLARLSFTMKKLGFDIGLNVQEVIDGIDITTIEEIVENEINGLKNSLAKYQGRGMDISQDVIEKTQERIKELERIKLNIVNTIANIAITSAAIENEMSSRLDINNGAVIDFNSITNVAVNLINKCNLSQEEIHNLSADEALDFYTNISRLILLHGDNSDNLAGLQEIQNELIERISQLEDIDTLVKINNINERLIEWSKTVAEIKKYTGESTKVYDEHIDLYKEQIEQVKTKASDIINKNFSFRGEFSNAIINDIVKDYENAINGGLITAEDVQAEKDKFIEKAQIYLSISQLKAFRINIESIYVNGISAEYKNTKITVGTIDSTDNIEDLDRIIEELKGVRQAAEYVGYTENKLLADRLLNYAQEKRTEMLINSMEKYIEDFNNGNMSKSQAKEIADTINDIFENGTEQQKQQLALILFGQRGLVRTGLMSGKQIVDMVTTRIDKKMSVMENKNSQVAERFISSNSDSRSNNFLNYINFDNAIDALVGVVESCEEREFRKHTGYDGFKTDGDNLGQKGAIITMLAGGNFGLFAEVGLGKTLIADTVALIRSYSGQADTDIIVQNDSEVKNHYNERRYMEMAGAKVYDMTEIAKEAQNNPNKIVVFEGQQMTALERLNKLMNKNLNVVRIWQDETFGFLRTTAEKNASEGDTRLQEILQEFINRETRLTVADEAHKYMETTMSYVMSDGDSGTLETTLDDEQKKLIKDIYKFVISEKMVENVDYYIDNSGQVKFTKGGMEKVEKFVNEHGNDANSGKVKSMLQAISEYGKSKYMVSNDGNIVGTDAIGKLVTMGSGQAQPSMILGDRAYAYAAAIQCYTEGGKEVVSDEMLNKAFDAVRVSRTTYGTSRSGLFYGNGQYVGMSGTMGHIEDLSSVYDMDVVRFGDRKNFSFRADSLLENLEMARKIIEDSGNKDALTEFNKLLQNISDEFGFEFTEENLKSIDQEQAELIDQRIREILTKKMKNYNNMSKEQQGIWQAIYEAYNTVEFVSLQNGMNNNAISIIAADTVAGAGRGMNQLIISQSDQTLQQLKVQIDQQMQIYQQKNEKDIKYEILEINGTVTAEDINEYIKANKNDGVIRIVLANERGGMGLNYYGNWDLRIDSTDCVYSFIHQSLGRVGRHSGELFSRTIYGNMKEVNELLQDVKDNKTLLEWLAYKFENNPEYQVYDIELVERDSKGNIIGFNENLSDEQKMQVAKMLKGFIQSSASLIFGMSDTLDDKCITSALNQIMTMEGVSNAEKLAILNILDEKFNNHSDGEAVEGNGDFTNGRDQITNSIKSKQALAIPIFEKAVAVLSEGKAKTLAEDWLSAWQNISFVESENNENDNPTAIVNLEIAPSSVQQAVDIMYSQADKVMPYYGSSVDAQIKTLQDAQMALAEAGISLDSDEGVAIMNELTNENNGYIIGDNLTDTGSKFINSYIKVSDDDDLARALAILLGKILLGDGDDDKDKKQKITQSAIKQAFKIDDDDLARALAILLGQMLGLDETVADTDETLNLAPTLVKAAVSKGINIDGLIELVNSGFGTKENLSKLNAEEIIKITNAQHPVGMKETLAQQGIELPSAVEMKAIEILKDKGVDISDKYMNLYNSYNNVVDMYNSKIANIYGVSLGERYQLFKESDSLWIQGINSSINLAKTTFGFMMLTPLINIGNHAFSLVNFSNEVTSTVVIQISSSIGNMLWKPVKGWINILPVSSISITGLLNLISGLSSLNKGRQFNNAVKKLKEAMDEFDEVKNDIDTDLTLEKLERQFDNEIGDFKDFKKALKDKGFIIEVDGKEILTNDGKIIAGEVLKLQNSDNYKQDIEVLKYYAGVDYSVETMDGLVNMLIKLQKKGILVSSEDEGWTVAAILGADLQIINEEERTPENLETNTKKLIDNLKTYRKNGVNLNNLPLEPSEIKELETAANELDKAINPTTGTLGKVKNGASAVKGGIVSRVTKNKDMQENNKKKADEQRNNIRQKQADFDKVKEQIAQKYETEGNTALAETVRRISVQDGKIVFKANIQQIQEAQDANVVNQIVEEVKRVDISNEVEFEQLIIKYAETNHNELSMALPKILDILLEKYGIEETGKKQGLKGLIGVTKPEETREALEALFAVFDNPDDIAKMFGYESMEEVAANGTKQEIINKCDRMISKAETGEYIGLLTIARDVLITVSENNDIVEDVKQARIDNFKDKLIVSKAVNMNVIIKQAIEDDENFVINLAEIKEKVEQPGLNNKTPRELLKELAADFRGGKRGNKEIKKALMDIADIHAIAAAA